MKVAQLARAAGVPADTVRFYTREGLLRPARDPDNGYQEYGSDDLARLRFARKARALGFTLREVADILQHADRDESPCPLVRDLFAKRLQDVEAQLRELQTLRDRMRRALLSWETMPDGTPDGHTLCRLIEHWDDDTMHDSAEGHCDDCHH
jgi:DNA-binding transcriptional MerR regulator